MAARHGWLMVALLLVAGCAGRPRDVATIAPALPSPAIEAAPLPPGASPGMLVPTPLADGSFPTPNRYLSGAGTLWHLRAALNVAALSCGGAAGEAIRAGYNGWLVRQRGALAAAAMRYAAEYRQAAAGTGFDDAMTRLYNFWSQTPVRPAFCAQAAAVMAQVAVLDAVALPVAADGALAALDRPFADFYRAYDRWRRARPVAPVIAAAAPVVPVPSARPRLVLDLSTLPVDAEMAAPVSAR